MSFEEKIKRIIAKKLRVDLAKVVDGAFFVEDLGFDSIEGVELIFAVEEEFGIDISDEIIDNMNTVGDFINFLKDRTNN
jgi:acyl carrier protein